MNARGVLIFARKLLLTDGCGSITRTLLFPASLLSWYARSAAAVTSGEKMSLNMEYIAKRENRRRESVNASDQIKR